MKQTDVFTRDEVIRVNEIMIEKGRTKADAAKIAKFRPAKLTREEINRAYAEVRRIRAAKV